MSSYTNRGLCEDCGRPQKIMVKGDLCYVCQLKKAEQEQNKDA